MIVYGNIKSSAKRIKRTRKNPANQNKNEVKTYKPSSIYAPRGKQTII